MCERKRERERLDLMDLHTHIERERGTLEVFASYRSKERDRERLWCRGLVIGRVFVG